MSTLRPHKYISQKQVDQLYSLIKEVDAIFKKMDISYFVIGGTLLGAIRHGGLIPWDDDIDIGIFEHDTKKLFSKRLERQLEKRGLVLNTEDDLGTYKIHYKRGQKIQGYSHRFPFLDIFVYKKLGQKGKEKYVIADEDARSVWPKDVYPVKDLFPLVDYSFGPLMLPGPLNSRKLLKKIYGQDVFETYYEEYDHQKETRRKKVKKDMLPWDYIPVLPSGTKICWDT